jgi:hypothetical protein
VKKNQEPIREYFMPKKIISFSLWGDDPFYNVGAIRNAENALVHYEGWTCKFYIGTDVPKETVEALQQMPNTEIVIMENEDNNWMGMFWRFYAISDPDAEFVIFRDTDCRLTNREAQAVREWARTNKCLHIMRDHPMHTEPIMGGMWGVRVAKFMKKCADIWSDVEDSIAPMKDIIDAWILNERGRTKQNEVNSFKDCEYDAKGIDQKFLRAFVYNLAWNDSHIHDSFPIYNSFSGRFDYQRYPEMKEMNTGFPTARQDWNDFVGQIWDENEIANEESAVFLSQRDECIYMDWNKA